MTIGYGIFSWWWAHSCPKHVEKSNKHMKKICPPSCFYLQDYTRMHGQQNIQFGRTPLDERSAWHRDLYPTKHNTHNRHPCPRRDPNQLFQQATALDRAATEMIGHLNLSSDRLYNDRKISSSALRHHALVQEGCLRLLSG